MSVEEDIQAVTECGSMGPPGLSLRSGQRRSDPIPYMGNLVRPLVTGPDTGGRLGIIHSVERRGCEPPRHRHRNEDELVYVLEGEITFYMDNEPYRATPGTCVLLPRRGEHCYRVESQEVSLLTILMPAGLEGYYAELAWPQAEPDIERLATVAAKYGIEITGPAPG